MADATEKVPLANAEDIPTTADAAAAQPKKQEKQEGSKAAAKKAAKQAQKAASKAANAAAAPVKVATAPVQSKPKPRVEEEVVVDHFKQGWLKGVYGQKPVSYDACEVHLMVGGGMW